MKYTSNSVKIIVSISTTRAKVMNLFYEKEVIEKRFKLIGSSISVFSERNVLSIIRYTSRSVSREESKRNSFKEE